MYLIQGRGFLSNLFRVFNMRVIDSLKLARVSHQGRASAGNNPPICKPFEVIDFRVTHVTSVCGMVKTFVRRRIYPAP